MKGASYMTSNTSEISGSADLTTREIDLLEETFNALAPQGDQIVTRFYAELFARHPAVKPMFDGANIEAQQKKLLGALVLVIESLRDPAALGDALTQLGARHERYGAEPAHYTAVVDVLLDVLEEVAGDRWTTEVAQTWARAFDFVGRAMLSGYRNEKILEAESQALGEAS